MFGYKKLIIAIVENMKILTKEAVNKNELLDTHNGLLVEQNHHLRLLAQYTKRIDDFNRVAFEAGSGYQVPEDTNDEKALEAYKEIQNQERDALNEMYYSDISLAPDDDEA